MNCFRITILFLLLLFPFFPGFAGSTPQEIKDRANTLIGKEVIFNVSHVRVSQRQQQPGQVDVTLYCTDNNHQTAGKVWALAPLKSIPLLTQKYGTRPEFKDGRIQSREIKGILRKDQYGILSLDLNKTDF